MFEIGFADNARFAVRGAERVGRGKLVQPEHAQPPAGEVEKRGCPHRSEPGDHHIVSIGHGSKTMPISSARSEPVIARIVSTFQTDSPLRTLNLFFLFLREPPRHADGMEGPTRDEIRAAVKAALVEDIGAGDATTVATVSEHAQAVAVICAREPIVVAGLEFAVMAFQEMSPGLDFIEQCADGDSLSPGAALLNVRGSARALLAAERVALNFLQRLSGIATLTRRFVEAVAGTGAKILDTRKTTPGMRRFEKYAVVCGGGTNHRFGLYDLILIKDNHLAALRNEKPSAINAAVAAARRCFPALQVEVEADDLGQVREAMEAGADIILLDNMKIEDLRTATALRKGGVKLEASGGVNLETVRAIAETGVDFISVGALTHSARAVDIGLDFQ